MLKEYVSGLDDALFFLGPASKPSTRKTVSSTISHYDSLSNTTAWFLVDGVISPTQHFDLSKFYNKEDVKEVQVHTSRALIDRQLSKEMLVFEWDTIEERREAAFIKIESYQ